MKSNKLPMISVVICSYNAPEVISRCIESVLKQKYPGRIEILVVDGGSDKKTIQKLMQYEKEIVVLNNPKKFPEGKGMGKWLGYNKAKGNIVAFIDQDNILQRCDLFLKVKEIFSKEKKLAGILGGLMHDKKDELIVRYVSLVGTDSFFAYRSLDFLQRIEKLEKGRGSKIVSLNVDNMSLTGGNCFFYLKKDLDKVGGYDQDVLVLQRLIKRDKKEIMIVSNATKHYAEKDIYSLIKKKFYWGKKYYERENKEKFDYFPKTKLEKNKFLKNLIFNLLIFPNIIYSIKLYESSRDVVSFLFPFIAFLNTIAYGINFLLFRKQMHLV